jgi:hypothetical protein
MGQRVSRVIRTFFSLASELQFFSEMLKQDCF